MSLTDTIKIDLDISDDNYTYINEKQYDKNSRYILVTVTNNRGEFIVDSSIQAKIKWRKPDGKNVFNDCTVTDDGKILIALTEQMLMVYGTAYAEVQLYSMKDEELLSTMPFSIYIKKSVFDDNKIISTNEWNSLINLYNNFRYMGESESERVTLEELRKTNENIRIENENQRMSNETTRAQSENDRNTSETERNTNEVDRINNELVRVNSENDKNSAENIRESNEAIRISKENTRNDNETQRETNETVRSNSEDIRVANESNRENSEVNRDTSETIRENNENTRVFNETGRTSAENIRITNEELRDSNETIRKTNEDLRSTSEKERVLTENTRKDNEAIRANKETERTSAENTRIQKETIRETSEINRTSAENERASAEVIRETNETNRVELESIRTSNEESRIVAEQLREANCATTISVAETATINANKATDRANKAAEGCEGIISGTGFIPSTEKGAANGVATLDENGFILSTQIPGTYDNVDNGEATGVTTNSNTGQKSAAGFIKTGETSECVPKADTIYVDIVENIQYRWSGEIYIAIGGGLALGETDQTAYVGSKGKIAYEHSQVSGNPHNTSKTDVGLDLVDNTPDEQKNVATAVKANQDSLGNEISETYLSYYCTNVDSEQNTSDTMQKLKTIKGEDDAYQYPYTYTSLVKNNNGETVDALIQELDSNKVSLEDLDKIGSNIKEIETNAVNILALNMAIVLLQQSIVAGTSDNIFIETFENDNSFRVASGIYDSENKRMYA